MAETTVLPAKTRSDETSPEQTRGGVFFTPRVDICETEKELILYADVPGVRAGDVELRYEDGELLLHARVSPRQPGGNWLLQEYEEGDFYRAFRIHESIDNSRIEAKCKNGILVIHLPKVASAQPRQIQVTGT